MKIFTMQLVGALIKEELGLVIHSRPFIRTFLSNHTLDFFLN